MKQALIHGIKQDLPALVIGMGYVILTSALLASRGEAIFGFLSVLSNFVLVGLGLLLVGSVIFLWLLFRHRPDSPISFARELAEQHDLKARALRSVGALAVLSIFLPAFSRMKDAIPIFAPFTYDARFAEIDAQIHGGPAWHLLEPLLHNDIALFTVSNGYQFWILFLYVGAPLVCFWMEPSRLRLQFQTAFFLCWALLGTWMAILFASVGPCFLEAFNGDGQFRPLMNALNQADKRVPILALDVQQLLIRWKEDGTGELGAGISAMPSMHLSVATLFALFGWRVSTSLGAMMTAFLVLIMLGSVLLGYHYAIDGYVSIIATVAIWIGSGWVATIWNRFAPPAQL